MITFDHPTLKRVNKTRARNLYNQGKTIYVVPNKVYPDFNGAWIRPFGVVLGETDFDTRVNLFEHYNCAPELGNYAAFYVKK